MTALTVQRIAAFGLNSRDAIRLSDFYRSAFGCRLLNTQRLEGGAFETLMEVRGGATQITLGLGRETIEILQFDTPGQPYPEPLSPIDNAFQHFALVVTDIEAAWRRLSQLCGWTAISIGGPQLLPSGAGNVKAFKFRDPERHPLELLEFPDARRPPYWNDRSGELFLGIDHSAISVTDVQVSIDFYQRLGLRVAERTLNHGIEQQRLDGISNPHVDVVALEPGTGTPHVELLHYRTTAPRHPVTLHSDDLAATRLVMEAAAPSMHAALELPDSMLRDPDGHLIHLIAGETSLSASPSGRYRRSPSAAGSPC